MSNYYEILEISRKATRAEVRSAFRRLAKKHHPDRHPPERGRWAHDRMQEILRAYEVLRDDEKRAVYDRTLSRFDEMRAPSLRETLKKRRSDPAACCQLILLDLIESRGPEALALFEELSAQKATFGMAEHMPLADYLDCEFLLAEEYERSARPARAFEIYRMLYEEDLRYNYFKHFREEILLRLRNLAVRLLGEEERLGLVLESLSGTLRRAFPRRERAFIYKKLAERFSRAGNGRLARLHLLSALVLNPRLAGAKKIRRRLEIDRSLIGRRLPRGER